MPDATPAGSSSPAAPDSRFLSRAYQAGDEAAILDLFATSFHVPRSIEHWRWKFEDDPFGDRHISETFDAAGKLIGHYAGYVVPLRDGDRDLLVHQVGDTMTDAAVRHIGRGPSSILGRTAAHFYRTF